MLCKLIGDSRVRGVAPSVLIGGLRLGFGGVVISPSRSS